MRLASRFGSFSGLVQFAQLAPALAFATACGSAPPPTPAVAEPAPVATNASAAPVSSASPGDAAPAHAEVTATTGTLVDDGEASADGDSAGYGGLGLRGTGPGGGGTGEGDLGTLGSGRGTGSGKTPRVKGGDANVNGSLTREVIRRIVRRNIGSVRLCYEKGLAADPTLAGKVAVRFVIDKTGAVASATADAATDLQSPTVVECVTRAVLGLAFPKPDGGGAVTVNYPFVFAPTDAAAKKP